MAKIAIYYYYYSFWEACVGERDGMASIFAIVASFRLYPGLVQHV